jgi:hypothetical protein
VRKALFSTHAAATDPSVLPLQRIYETMHVHKFSHATMPLFNLFKNCTYYWAFSAFVSYFINHPKYTPPPMTLTVGCLFLAFFCQACHPVLSSGQRTLAILTSVQIAPQHTRLGSIGASVSPG